MQTPPPIKTRKKTSALKVGLLFGSIFSLIQFCVSELLYQTSLLDDSELAYQMGEMAEIATFPAGDVYDHFSGSLLKKQLNSSSQTDSDLNDEDRKAAEDLHQKLDNNSEDDSALNEAYELLYKYNIPTDLPTSIEYAIYGGVCILWGSIFGMSVGFFVRISNKPSKPKPLQTAF